jgi:hypothetical protein
VIGAAADALGFHQAREHGSGLEGGHVAGGIPVTEGSRPRLCRPARRSLRGHRYTGAVDRGIQLVRQRGRRQRDQLAARDRLGPVPDRGGGSAAGLGGPLDALGGQAHSAQVLQQPGSLRERPGGSSLVVHHPQARGQRLAGHAEHGVPGGEPVLAGGAVIPGARQGDRPEHGVGHLIPVGDELCLMSLAARHPRAAVVRIGGQQLLQHVAARLQHPGADHRLGSLHARAAAAQRPGRFRRQPAYLGGLLLRDRVAEPLFSPSGTEDAPVPAAGLAS